MLVLAGTAKKVRRFKASDSRARWSHLMIMFNIAAEAGVSELRKKSDGWTQSTRAQGAVWSPGRDPGPEQHVTLVMVEDQIQPPEGEEETHARRLREEA